tara:strand:- start:332 stop:1207 length:876 start_codon:yes stop_codon:yes gene_type:complete
MAKKVSANKKGAGTGKKKVKIKKLTPKKDLKIEPKNTSKNTAINTPKIEETIIEKEDNNVVENGTTREEVAISASENDVLSMLRIPVVNTQENEIAKPPEKEAPPEFEGDPLSDPNEPFFGDEKEEDPFATEDQKENIKSEFDEYEMGDDGDFMMGDHALMAEMGVEIIDLLMTTGAMAIAKDFGNEEKYSVSDYRKAKLKKPLAMLLEKKGKTLPPEVMFVLVIIGVYAPTMMTALQERQKKANDIKIKAQKERQEEEVKKKGRPKGSKDSKPRKSKIIEIKPNEPDPKK